MRNVNEEMRNDVGKGRCSFLLRMLLLTAFVISHFSFLTSHSSAQLARYRHDYTLNRSNFVDSIAIEWDHDQVFLPVEIGGQTYRFLFDTGAAQAVVYGDSPIDGCRPAGFIRSQDATGATDTVPLVTLPPLTLGQLTLTGCQATIHRRPVAGRKIDGIIGFDLINRGLSAKIDVRNRLLILTDRKKFFKHEPGLEVRYKLKYHVPYLEVSPATPYKELTLFDTGSRGLYTMNRHSYDACAAKMGSQADSLVEGRSMGRHAIAHFGIEKFNEVVFLHLQQLRVCDYAFCDVHTLTTQGESSLGAAVLNYGAMIFNPHKKRVCFQPYNQQKEVVIANKQLDIAFVPEHGMPSVGLVWERSEPYMQGFRQGDVILRIDDAIVRDFTQFVFWPFVMGREYRFTVRGRDGQTRELHWTRIKGTPSSENR